MKYCPKNRFSPYEEYAQYLKEMRFALEAHKGTYNF